MPYKGNILDVDQLVCALSRPCAGPTNAFFVQFVAWPPTVGGIVVFPKSVIGSLFAFNVEIRRYALQSVG